MTLPIAGGGEIVQCIEYLVDNGRRRESHSNEKFATMFLNHFPAAIDEAPLIVIIALSATLHRESSVSIITPSCCNQPSPGAFMARTD